MSASELSESEFEIERILKHRKKGKTTEYLIRWKGYDSEEDEWIKEPEIAAKGLISDYEMSLKKPKKIASRAAKTKAASAISEVTVTKSSQRKTAVQSMTFPSSVVESETSDIEIFDETPVTTRRTMRTETRVWQTGGDRDDYHKVTESQQLMKQDTSPSNSSQPRRKKILFQLTRQDVPMIVFLCCLLFILLSFVYEDNMQ